MKAFSEKSDHILRSLAANQQISWDKFHELTGISRDDVILDFLKDNKGFIEYTEREILITNKGKEFITRTSFVEQRDKQDYA